MCVPLGFYDFFHTVNYKITFLPSENVCIAYNNEFSYKSLLLKWYPGYLLIKYKIRTISDSHALRISEITLWLNI